MQTPTYYGNIGILSGGKRRRARLHRRFSAWLKTMPWRRRRRRRDWLDGGAVSPAEALSVDVSVTERLRASA